MRLPAVCSTVSYFQVILLSSQVSGVRCAASPYVTQSANSLHDKKKRLYREAWRHAWGKKKGNKTFQFHYIFVFIAQCKMNLNVCGLCQAVCVSCQFVPKTSLYFRSVINFLELWNFQWIPQTKSGTCAVEKCFSADPIHCPAPTTQRLYPISGSAPPPFLMGTSIKATFEEHTNIRQIRTV